MEISHMVVRPPLSCAGLISAAYRGVMTRPAPTPSPVIILPSNKYSNVGVKVMRSPPAMKVSEVYMTQARRP